MSRKKRQRRAVLSRRARKLERLFPQECKRWNARIRVMEFSRFDSAFYAYPPGWGMAVIYVPATFSPHQTVCAVARQFVALDRAHGTPERSQATFDQLRRNMEELHAWSDGGPRPSWIQRK